MTDQYPWYVLNLDSGGGYTALCFLVRIHRNCTEEEREKNKEILPYVKFKVNFKMWTP